MKTENIAKCIEYASHTLHDDFDVEDARKELKELESEILYLRDVYVKDTESDAVRISELELQLKESEELCKQYCYGNTDAHKAIKRIAELEQQLKDAEAENKEMWNDLKDNAIDYKNAERRGYELASKKTGGICDGATY